MSEQQFSASLENGGVSPNFVVEPEPQSSSDFPDPRLDCEPATSCNPQSDKRPDSDDPSSKNESSVLEQQLLVSDSLQGSSANSDWREQVSAKVNSYKSRRPSKLRYPSLHLQFEPRDYSPQTTQFVFEPVEETPQLAVSAPGLADSPVLMEATARVLEFPRPSLAAPVRRDELADPVIDRPRILEAPELLPPPPAMGGILIEARQESQPERSPGLDFPLQSAPLSRRFWAGGIDGLIIAVAVGIFGYVFLRFAGAAPPWRTEVEIVAALVAVLWPAYQYSLVVHSGTTPGLRLAKLCLQQFDGSAVPKKLRRWRVLASLLSAASLGLGYAWCFLDEDQLSWHDRITKTHLGCKLSSNPDKNQ